jgi:Flp pilus assembly pilin Flp
MNQIALGISRLRRLRRDTIGATIVEFAIILGPMCALILGGLDLGYQTYLRSVVQGALNDVARSASMEAPDLNCTGDTIKDKIGCAIKGRSDIVARNATYQVTMRNYYQFSAVGRPEKLVTDYNGNGQYDSGDCWEDLNENGTHDVDAGRDGVGGADDVVFYNVTVTMPRLFPLQGLIGAPDHYTINAQAALRNQPYARQKVPPVVCG